MTLSHLCLLQGRAHGSLWCLQSDCFLWCSVKVDKNLAQEIFCFCEVSDEIKNCSWAFFASVDMYDGFQVLCLADPKNLKLFYLSSTGVGFILFMLSSIFSVLYPCKIVNFLSVWAVIAVWNPADGCRWPSRTDMFVLLEVGDSVGCFLLLYWSKVVANAQRQTKTKLSAGEFSVSNAGPCIKLGSWAQYDCIMKTRLNGCTR